MSKLSLLALFMLSSLLVGIALGLVVVSQRTPVARASVLAQQPGTTVVGRTAAVTAPRTVLFQGYLRNPASGSPVSNGNYQVTVSLYSTSTGGVALWTETQTVNVSGGFFQSVIGGTTPIISSLLQTPQLWIGVKVGSGTEMTPRLRVTSAFYSVQANESGRSQSAGVSSEQIASQKWGAIRPLGSHATFMGVDVSGPGLDASDPMTSITFDNGHLWVSTPTRIFSKGNNTLKSGTFVYSPQGGGCTSLVGDDDRTWCLRPGAVVRATPSQESAIKQLTCADCRRGAFDGLSLWVTNYSAGQVHKVSIPSFPLDAQPSITTTVTVGSQPLGVTFDGENIWVANSGSNSVTKIRVSDAQVLGTFATGNAPIDILFDGASIWVLNSQDATVQRLRSSDGANLGTASAGATPSSFVYDGALLWVLSIPNKAVTLVRSSDGITIGTTSIAAQAVLGMAFDGEGVWIASQRQYTSSELRWAATRY